MYTDKHRFFSDQWSVVSKNSNQIRNSTYLCSFVLLILHPSSLILHPSDDGLVGVAPPPSFARFKGTHNGVLTGVIVFRSVFILGRVTTPDMPTTKTHAKVYPFVAHLKAFFTAFGVGRHLLDLDSVRTLHANFLSKHHAKATC
jgi:hypothetical protein